MLVAHGTTEKNADLIEKCGYFNENTYFMKLSPDFKLGLVSTACFALRDHPKLEDYIDLYCKQDLLIRPFKNALIKEGQEYTEEKDDDKTPAIIYVVDIPEEDLDYHRGLRSVFIPAELFSTKKIPTSKVDHIITLEENIEHFRNRYEHEVKELKEIEVDNLAARVFYTISYRFNRLVLRKK